MYYHHAYTRLGRYMTAVVVKDKMDEWLEPVDADTPHSQVRYPRVYIYVHVNHPPTHPSYQPSNQLTNQPHPKQNQHILQVVRRSALKAVTAGLAGAVLTNPLDVLRNECFKREQPVGEALRGLYRDEGLAFLHRCVSSCQVLACVWMGCA